MDKKIVFAAIAIFFLTIGAGVYAQDFGSAEMVHFQIAVPAGEITGPVIVKNGGASIAMAPVTINLVYRGLPKVLLNGNIEGMSTHGITNTGKKPVRIRMEMVNATIPIDWEVSANAAYDPETRTFTTPLEPGRSIRNLGLDWYFQLPEEKRFSPVVYDGGLKLSDADTGELLTFLPVRIVNEDSGSGTGAEACH